MTRFLSLSLSLLLWALPLTARAQDKPAPTAWELSPYRIQLFTAVDAGPSLPGSLEKDLPGDLAARIPALVGGMWHLKVGPAPKELKQRMLRSLPHLSADELPAAAKTGDKVILLGVTAKDGGFLARARELDLSTGLWNTTVSRNFRQAGSVRTEALWCLLSAFAPQARIEKVEEGSVSLKLRASALARADSGLPLVPSGAVFRPALMKCSAKGEIQPGVPELIPWTFLAPTGAATVGAEPVTARIVTGLAGTPLPEYHPTRMRLALGVSLSRDSTKVKLVAEGSGAPLEGYEVAAQEPEIGGKPGLIVSLGQSGADGVVVVQPSLFAVRWLLVRHGAQVLARLPLVPGLAEEVTLTLPDDGPRLAVEIALTRIQDDLVDLVARREVLVSRAKAAAASRNTSAADRLKEELRKLPGLDPLLAEIGKQQQAADALEGPARQRMQARLTEIRKLAEKLKSENPASKL